ncbi:probable cytochrome P450 28d1 [Microplitis mediator]|uniref:probable cytochrome P450 28d1 n=1 Tax=Microplitis mediator TaxID=375433 RepID=UPI002554ABDC|nr:probable cytochrome P450 28d1 [Microplitis mediator]
MGWIINYAIGTIAVLMIIIYKYLTCNYNYWKKRGIPTAKGILPGFGHMLDVFMLRKNVSTQLQEIYEAHPADSMVGIYDMRKPVLLIRHPELVKAVLQTEFASFSDHITLDPHTDFLLAMDPFFVNGEVWKNMRAVFTSAFSTKKLKFVSSVAKDTCDDFVKFIDKKVVDNNNSKEAVEVNAKVLFSKFTAQLGGSAIFGVEGNAFADVDPPGSFRAMMNSMLEINTSTAIRLNIVLSLPLMGKLLKVSFVPKWVNERFNKIVNDIREMRKNQSINRDDLLQHIIDHEGSHKYGNNVSAHAFSFFTEGYESSSLTLSATAYLLAKHPDFQDRAREEVVSVLSKYKEICYEALNEMTFLDKVFRETMRLFSPVGKFQKICSKPITLQGPDGLSCSLKPGDEVFISAMGIHYDPEIWENPNEFNPDRFDKDSAESQRKFVHLSFGEGPRVCPGIRMGMLQIKAAMATILKNYIIEPSSKMIEPVTIDPKYFLTSIKGGFWVKLKRC